VPDKVIDTAVFAVVDKDCDWAVGGWFTAVTVIDTTPVAVPVPALLVSDTVNENESEPT
jgi:hypothetical protein